MNVALLCLLAAGLAGWASTLLELAWLRVASAALPGTLPAGALVLPALFLAWALGAGVAGRWADRTRACLPSAARWLAAGAAGVLLAPAALAALLPGEGAAQALTRALAAGLPAAPAAFCLGGTLPLLARLRRDAGIPPVRAAGGVTAALTAGGALGAASFVDRLAASPGPLTIAALALAGAALLCWVLAAWEPPRSARRAGGPAGRDAPAAAPHSAADADGGEGALASALLGLAALVGGAALIVGQLALLRALAQRWGDSLMTSSAVLAAAHVGMALGALLLCTVPARARSANLVAPLLAIAAVALLLPAALLPAHAEAPIATLALACGVPLGASAGCLVTAASRGRSAPRWGGWIGSLTLLSTLGGGAGGALYVWVLSPAPAVGTGGSLRLSALVLALVAVLVGLSGARSRAAPRAARGAAGACAVLAAGVALVAWRASPLDLGWRSGPDETALLRGGEGPWGVVSLVATTDGGARLKLDGRFGQGGTQGALLARRLGRVAATFRPQAERALLLGLGMGHTLAGLAAVTPAAVECVEHNAQILALDLPVPFEAERMPPGGLPRILHADARAWLADHPRTYDLIVGDLFFPWMPGAGDLFSREAFLRMRAALREDGVAVQWLPLHQMPWLAFASAANAFTEAFPDARLFIVSARAGSPLVALVGGLVKGLPRAEDVDALLARAPSSAGPNVAAEVWDLYLADSWTLQSRFRDSPTDTLDAPWVEILSLGRQDDEDQIARDNLRLLAGLAVPLDTASLQEPPSDEKANRRLGAELTARSRALSSLLFAHAALRTLRDAPPGSLAQADRDALAMDAANALLLGWSAAPGHIDVRDLLLEHANELTREERWETAGALLQTASNYLADPRLAGLLGGILLHEHHTEEALAVLEPARQQAPDDRTVLVNLGSALLIAGRDAEARTALEQARRNFPQGAMPPLQGAALALLEGDARAASLAQALLVKMPPGEPWAAVLRRLLEHAGVKPGAGS